MQPKYPLKKQGDYTFIEEGEGQTMLLLHGLFGALSNWDTVVDHFKDRYRVIIPLLPIYEGNMLNATIDGLTKFVEEFVGSMKLRDLILLGNSLGGHVGLVFTLRNPKAVSRLVLTGSSGLFENSLGGSFPKRGSYEYVKERVEYTFYNPSTATKELIDEVFDTTKSIPKCMRIVSIAKSAQRHNLAKDLPNIHVPTLLIWGLNDTITPPMVAYEFNRLMINSQLRFIDHCCHAPMMENPERFNELVDEFLVNELAAAAA